MVDILTTAGVSAGSFHNIFRTKDGVLLDLTQFMFTNQFNIAEMFLGEIQICLWFMRLRQLFSLLFQN